MYTLDIHVISSDQSVGYIYLICRQRYFCLGIILTLIIGLFQVSWPMNILIPPDQLTKYERIFSFMVSLKHISYLLADSWHSLKLSTQTHQIESGQSHQFRQLHLIRYIIPKRNDMRTDCLPLIYSDHLDILI